MKALILSCGTGGGHNDAGRGIAEGLTERGHEAVFLNQYLGLAGKQVDQLICSIYMNTITRHPHAFPVVYGIGRGVSSALHPLHIQSPIYFANSRKLADILGSLIYREQFDVVLMPHLYPAETMTALKRRGFPLPPTIAVATDHTSIPFWEETDCDWYVTADEGTSRDFVRRGVPEEKLLPFGIPAPLGFCPPENREALRAELGFSPDKRYILLMSGSMGAGDIEGFIRSLRAQMDEKTCLLAVCGKNEQLRERLTLLYHNDKQVTVFGYMTETARYMQACDLLFTKPGGLSTTEAALCRIPTVLLPGISQCEEANRQFFLRNRIACQGKDDAQRISRGLKLLEPVPAAAMRRRQQEVFPDNPARAIAAFAERTVMENDGAVNAHDFL